MFSIKVRKIPKFFLSLFFISASAFAWAEVYSENQLIPAEHWIYDALYTLYNENASALIMDTAPLSVYEIKQSLNYVDYERLSDSGKLLYDRVEDYLFDKRSVFNMEPVHLGFNIQFHPSFMWKSNPDTEWSFATDYCGDNSNDAASDYYGDTYTDPFLRLPLYLDFADLIVIDMQASIGKKFRAMKGDYNFTNIILDGADYDIGWPVNANASTGYVFNNGLAVNFHVARTGLQMGHTQLGSIIYNNTFQTDFYANLRLSGKKLKYEMTLAQVDKESYLYLHNIDFTIWPWLKLGALEGTYINAPFEIRYLNPLIIMHSFMGWQQYNNGGYDSYFYDESHFCAYLGIKFDIVAAKNFRIYGLMAQTEIQPPTELGSPEANARPDGIGFQLGLDAQHPDNHGGWYYYNIEGIYTHPWLYVKDGPAWSLYKSNNVGYAMSWIGSPLGPDALGGITSVEYKQTDKWSAKLSYKFVAHGENTFDMFSKHNYLDPDGKEDEKKEDPYKDLSDEDYLKKLNEEKTSGLLPEGDVATYFPAVRRKKGITKAYKLTDEEAAEIARDWWLSGCKQFTNVITLEGSYKFNKYFKLEGKAAYEFIFNNQNKNGNFANGVELELAGTVRVF